jgi:plastocyanin
MTVSESTSAKVAIFLAVPVIAGLAVIVTSLTSSGGSTAASAAGGPTGEIRNFSFSPTPLDVTAGTTVTVANDDDTAHTVTADEDGAFDTGPIDGGGHATFTVSTPGTYAYFCAIHSSMHGVIHVRPAAGQGG